MSWRMGRTTSRPDQKTLRWAKMAISSRMAGVGADCNARSIARLWRLIIRWWRMRSIMLMVVLTSSPASSASSLARVSCYSEYAPLEGELPINYMVTYGTCLTIEG